MSEEEKELLVSKFVEEGSAFIYPERMEKWKEFVTNRVNDPIDKGLSIQTTLNIMEQLESGVSLDEVLEEYHEMIDNLGEKEKLDQKDVPLKFAGNLMFQFGNAENGVEFYKRNAEYYYGKSFFDDEKTVQDIEIQNENNKRLAALHEKPEIENSQVQETEKELSNEEKITKFIENGKNYIYPEKMEKWKESVTNRVNDPLDKGLSIQTTLDIMEKLKSGVPLDDVLTEFYDMTDNLTEEEKRGQKDVPLRFVGNLMFQFGDVDYGVEFYKRNAEHRYGKSFFEDERTMQDIEMQNENNKRMAALQRQKDMLLEQEEKEKAIDEMFDENSEIVQNSMTK